MKYRKSDITPLFVELSMLMGVPRNQWTAKHSWHLLHNESSNTYTLFDVTKDQGITHPFGTAARSPKKMYEFLATALQVINMYKRARTIDGKRRTYKPRKLEG